VNVAFSRRAERDLMAQISWLSVRTPKAALRAADQIEAAVQLIRDFPLVAPVADNGFHELTVPFGRDGFLLRYRVAGETATIVRLFHGRQARRRV
jgi:plasmid stabilization system protein ParE